MNNRDHISQIVIVGLGYVGLPLALALAPHFRVIGFDVSRKRISQLQRGHDLTGEFSREEIEAVDVSFTSDPACLAVGSSVIIVCVPTPVDAARVPDLSLVEAATRTIAEHLEPGSTVVYESTVYPGVTEDVCVPLLEAHGLTHREHFWVGYSPERVVPGDKTHTIDTITKLVAGDNDVTSALLERVYSTFTNTYRCQSIKVAEAAKVIENTQRDVNIGLMNELSAIFDRLDIDTLDVLQAAATKWNFLPFTPGLVGGHCISVDPYYLTHRAQQAGYIPSLILAAREVNDQAPVLIAYRFLQALSKAGRLFRGTVVTVMGVTFKEGVSDVRNSKVSVLVEELRRWGLLVQVVDPRAHADEVWDELGLVLETDPQLAHGVIVAVAHPEYVEQGWTGVKKHLVRSGITVVADLKGALSREDAPPHIVLVRP